MMQKVLCRTFAAAFIFVFDKEQDYRNPNCQIRSDQFINLIYFQKLLKNQLKESEYGQTETNLQIFNYCEPIVPNHFYGKHRYS